MLSDSNARLASARRLTSRSARRDAGRFLAEGEPAVTAALGRPGAVVELFATAAALSRHGGVAAVAESAGVPVAEVSEKAAAGLSETVSPQGLVAVCHTIDLPLDEVMGRRPRLVAALVQPRDPGNVGTILRTADAAGADAVVLAGDSVDIYNGKTVRATAGSLFHLDVVVGVSAQALGDGGLTVLATTGAGETDLDRLVDDGTLRQSTLWLFGTEAHGLPESVQAAADYRVRIPIYGAAESLNLSAAAAICLYASARAQRLDAHGGPVALR
ncbi:MAG: TrmH family RNA methyltransferase [Jatrophihabitans sp.]